MAQINDHIFGVICPGQKKSKGEKETSSSHLPLTNKMGDIWGWSLYRHHIGGINHESSHTVSQYWSNGTVVNQFVIIHGALPLELTRACPTSK